MLYRVRFSGLVVTAVGTTNAVVLLILVLSSMHDSSSNTERENKCMRNYGDGNRQYISSLYIDIGIARDHNINEGLLWYVL